MGSSICEKAVFSERSATPYLRESVQTNTQRHRGELSNMDRAYAQRMWSEAFEMLAQADRMHRELFRPAGSAPQRVDWEPPVDILETRSEVLILVALPGVAVDKVVAVIEGDDLVIAGD